MMPAREYSIEILDLNMHISTYVYLGEYKHITYLTANNCISLSNNSIPDLNMHTHLQQKSHSPGNKGQSVPTLMRHCETKSVFLGLCNCDIHFLQNLSFSAIHVYTKKNWTNLITKMKKKSIVRKRFVWKGRKHTYNGSLLQ